MSRIGFASYLLQVTVIGVICLNSAAAQQGAPTQPAKAGTEQAPAAQPAKTDTTCAPPDKADTKAAQTVNPSITNGPLLIGDKQIQATIDKSVTDVGKIHAQVNDDPNNVCWRTVPLSQAQIASPGNFSGQLSETFKSGQQVEIGVGDLPDKVTWSQYVTVQAGAPGRPGGLFLRTIVGFNQSGASSAQSSQQFFLDLYVSSALPLEWAYGKRKSYRNINPENNPENGPVNSVPCKADNKTTKPEVGGMVTPNNIRQLGEEAQPSGDFDLGSRLRLWADVRIDSAPQQLTTTVSQLSSNLGQTVGNLHSKVSYLNLLSEGNSASSPIPAHLRAEKVSDQRLSLRHRSAWGLNARRGCPRAYWPWRISEMKPAKRVSSSARVRGSVL